MAPRVSDQPANFTPPVSRVAITMSSAALVLSVVLYFSFPTSLLVEGIYGVTAGSRSNPAQPKLKPNIVFVLLDDVGWNDLSFHGYDEMDTKNIDQLAADGVILNSFYGQYVCTPSRTALMTGRYPIRYGMQHSVLIAREPRGLDLSAKLLPQYLKELGYSTHLIGKWHLGHYQKRMRPTNRGFDTFFGYLGPGVDYFNYTTWGYFDALDLWDNDRPVKEVQGKHLTQVFDEVSVRRIEQHDVTKPLFLLISHTSLHQDKRHEALPVPQEYYDRFPNIKHTGRRRHVATMAMIDDSVKNTMNALKRKQMIGNTIVVVMSDNGGAGEEHNQRPPWVMYSSNWPLRGAKGSQWEGGVRVSALVSSPLLKNTGRVSNELYHMTDWLPTFVRLAGGSPMTISDLDGFDIWDSISSGAPSPRKEVFIQADPLGGEYAMRWHQYKLMYQENPLVKPRSMTDAWFEPSGGLHVSLMRNSPAALACDDTRKVICDPFAAPCLFDVIEDPCEFRNIADKHPDVVEYIMNRVTKYNVTYPNIQLAEDPRAQAVCLNNVLTYWEE